MENETTTLATEILRELQLSAKRWFIAFLVMLFLELATIAGFLWYISLPIDESSVTVSNEDDGSTNYIGGNMSGGVFNGQNRSNKETESGQK